VHLGVPPFLIPEIDKMKILSSQQIRECDAYTIANEPVSSIDLMERASLAFVKELERTSTFQQKRVSVFCGTGNNGGDGLVIARLLRNKGWDVDCYLVQFSENVSPDNQINQDRLQEKGGTLSIINTISDFPETIHEVIIDALVGNGITRPLEGLLGEVVRNINATSATVFSVDLPSGLYDQGDCTKHKENMIHADFCFTFQSAKLNFLIPEYSKIVGRWKVLDIGLDEAFIDSLSCNEYAVDEPLIRSLLKSRTPHSHKGTYGHAGLICGSKGMVGAAVLATSACLRSGAGLTTIMAPEVGYTILQTTCPEAMCINVGSTHLSDVPILENYSALGVGPGIGQHSDTREALLKLLDSCEKPVVLDADALNLLSESDLALLPKNSIITPHPKEFERLFGKTTNSHYRIALLRTKPEEHQIIILLKGHHTCIATPDRQLFFNTTGNPGMAKGGSGDVLTGLITGLVARGYSPQDASLLGCYLHGLAGDICLETLGMEGFTAMDIVEHLPAGWRRLYS